MKKKEIKGHSFYQAGDEYAIIVLPSATRGYYHVVIDDAFQDNKYFHMTKEGIELKFKGVKL